MQYNLALIGVPANQPAAQMGRGSESQARKNVRQCTVYVRILKYIESDFDTAVIHNLVRSTWMPMLPDSLGSGITLASAGVEWQIAPVYGTIHVYYLPWYPRQCLCRHPL